MSVSADVKIEGIAFPIVGIGASAGGLEAFSILMGEIPADTGMAFVLIQHLDPNHTSYLKEALSKFTAMPVMDIVHGTKLSPNHVYVMPSNVDLEISGCELQLITRNMTSGVPHMPINTFMKSLAKNCERRSIGVVLSGNGSDGTEGLRAIKNEGGFTFVQNPETAKYPSMPESAISAGVVDFNLPLKELAAELSYLAHHDYYINKAAEPLLESEDQEDFEKILSILKADQNIDFNEYKDATVKRRLVRRLALLRIEGLKDYLKVLQEKPDESKLLLEDILIHVTSFFRDPEVYVQLKESVFPQLLKDRSVSNPIRMWVAGCSTGEEVYSLVISLLEFLGENSSMYPIQVFGSDVSEKMIEKCRAGIYSEALVKGVSAERLKRFFVRVDNGYRINKIVRDLCVFVRHDLARDPPFSRLDLITCRNVLIYFDKGLQKRLLSTFHYCLKQPGYLLLGRTENATGFQQFFSSVDKVNKIFTRTPLLSQLRFQMPKEQARADTLTTRKINLESPAPQDISKSVDSILLSEYAPCGAIVNERFEVLQFRGRTGDYLAQPPGEPEANLLKMVREGLFVDLQMALTKSKNEKCLVRTGILKVKNFDFTKLCTISVRPLEGNSRENHFLVVFEELKSVERKPKWNLFSRTTKKDLHLEETRSDKLEKELQVTKEYLQSLNDEHQKTNEALATANEELVSGNEELQSMNEELETAKEELQSINEELTTVNDELQNSNQELGQVNNDLINLLNSVQIPIVILDVNRRIRRFTPHARIIMNLLANDIGRSIDDIKLNISIDNLEGQIAEATANDVVKESEVQDRDGKWYRIQIRPYKTQDNKIEGTVISVIDINTLRRKVDRAEWARDYAASIVNGMRIPLVVMDKELQVISANQAFYKFFSLMKSEHEQDLLSRLGINNWKIASLNSTLCELLRKNVLLQNAEVERDVHVLGKRTLSLTTQTIHFDSEVPNMILLAIEDISVRKEQEIEKTNLLRQAEDATRQLSLVTDSAPIHLMHLDKEEKFLFVNRSAAQMWQRSKPEMIGKSIRDIIGEEKQKSLHRYTEKVLRGENVSYESIFTNPDGTDHTFLNTYTPDIDSGGGVQGFVVTGTDITERKEIEQELQSTVTNLAEERVLIERFIFALSHDLRTPLAVSRLAAEMLMKKTMDPAQIEKNASRIVMNMERADSMIRDLLDANKLKSGERLKLNLEECDLNQIATEVVEDLKSIHENPLLLKADQHISGIWDRAAIKRMIENLISNAVKYGAPKSAVSISLGQKNGTVEISIHNEGNPIHLNDHKKIFEAFQRTSHAIGTKEGWGIGLNLVRGLALAHGGDVSLMSTAAEGTTFTITIPLHSH